MKLRVLYFAALREAMGRERDELDVPADVATVQALRDHLSARGAPWAAAFASVKRVRAAVNQQMASDEAALSEGAEVAFFPPVTGG